MNSQAIIQFFQGSYGLIVEEIVKIQSGMVGHNFFVRTKQGKYFVKIYGNSRLANISKGNVDFYVKVLDFLKDKKLKIPCIINNNEGLPISFLEKNPFIVFQFIEKDEQSYSNKEKELKLAKTLAEIHRTKINDNLKAEGLENFSSYFTEDLLEWLDELRQVDENAIFKVKLKKLLQPFGKKIYDGVENLKDLGNQCRGVEQDLVLCNSDPVGDNLIISKKECYLVDWDGAKFAPVEHDIWFYLGDKNFFQEYKKYNPKIKVYKENIGYYMYFRILEDLTDWIFRIMYENTTKEENEKDLLDLQTDCLIELENIEKDIEKRYETTLV